MKLRAVAFALLLATALPAFAQPAATGRVLWLNASDNGLTYTTAGNPPSGNATDGQAVQHWLAEEGDMSSRYLAATNESPLFDADGINSLGALQFDGSNDVMQVFADDGTTARALSDIITNSAFTIFIAFRVTATPSASDPAYNDDSLISDGGGYWGVFLENDTGVNYVTLFNYDGGNTILRKAVSLDTNYVFMGRHTGGNILASLNNDAESSTGSGNTGNLTNEIIIGASGFGENWSNVRIGEIICYSGALTGSDLTNTTTYMMDKWVNAGGGGGNLLLRRRR